MLLRPCLFYNQGLVPYETAWDWQRKWVAERRTHGLIKERLQPDRLVSGSDKSEFANSEHSDPAENDIFLLLEHPSVYTLGQGSSLEFLKFDVSNSPYPVIRIERGGEVTHHCPGQLVGYPILNLRFYQQDLHWYLRQLEEVLIRVLAAYQLQGDRIPGLTGVWVEGRKVAAIGIKVSRWITMHGFALNVCPDLSGFQHIIPCGIGDRPVGSLAEFIPDIQIDRVRQQVARAFAEVFQVRLIPVDLPLSCCG
ncbi:lipoyl(octanoyl) transferase LipB [Leptolyngbya sp. GB1-A1]|uniref:lipoyl(octanoyl) transferase LipB n=1 Tax=unclassified Leptolyngbya TaxID=2650499 RepID=UPI003297EE70